MDRRFRASGARSAEPKGAPVTRSTIPWARRSIVRRRCSCTGTASRLYVRVRAGLLWTRTVLIPVQFVETDDESETLALA